MNGGRAYWKLPRKLQMTKLALDAYFRRLYFIIKSYYRLLFSYFRLLTSNLSEILEFLCIFSSVFQFFPRISFVVFRVFLLFIFLGRFLLFFTIYQQSMSYCSWNCLSICNSSWGGNLIYRTNSWKTAIGTNPWKTPIGKRINRNNFQKRRLFYRSLFGWSVCVR